jgi:hypothetical protein
LCWFHHRAAIAERMTATKMATLHDNADSDCPVVRLPDERVSHAKKVTGAELATDR